MTFNTEVSPLVIELKSEAHLQAKELASEQSTPQKRRQVYLNTLAVCAVDSFLRWMEVETDLQAGDSWNPYLCGLFDVADLVIPNLGKLECRVVMPGEREIQLPAEAREDRIAYVGVRVEPALRQAQCPQSRRVEPALRQAQCPRSRRLNRVELLGFVRAADIDESATKLELEQLEPIENLIDYFFRLESGMAALQEELAVHETVQQRLETIPRAQIIARLERIVRQEPEYEWRTQGGKVFLPDLVGVGMAERESMDVDEEAEIAAQDLAEDLLEKLAEIWVDV